MCLNYDAIVSDCVTELPSELGIAGECVREHQVTVHAD